MKLNSAKSFIFQNTLLLLVTDQGFLKEHEAVWETLEDVSGQNNTFLNADFKVAMPKKAPESDIPLSKRPPTSLEEQQIENE